MVPELSGIELSGPASEDEAYSRRPSSIPLDERSVMAVLDTWRKRAKAEGQMHLASYRYFKRIHYCFLVTIVVLSTAAGSINIADSSSSNEDTCQKGPNFIQLGLGIVGLVSAALTTIHNYTNVALRYESHGFFDDEYDKLSREIQVHALLADSPNRIYVDKGVLLKEVKDKFDRLAEKAPKIPSHISESKKCKPYHPHRPVSFT